MSDKKDWLRVCNDQGISHEDFKMAFCDRCLQTECSRSIAGESRFEQRTATWYKRLFSDPSKLPEQDPRFVQIRAKKFLEIDPGPAPEVGQGAWVDPRDLASQQSKAPAPQEALTSTPDPQRLEALPESGPIEASEPAAPEPSKQSKPLPSVPQLMNTPAQGPQMIGGSSKASSKPAPPVSDPWEPKPKPEAPSDGIRVIKPGARIRFDDSGV